MVHSVSTPRTSEQEAAERLAQLTAIEATWQRRQAPLHPGDRMLWIGLAANSEVPPPGALQSNFIVEAPDRFGGDTRGNTDALPFAPASVSHVVVQHGHEVADDGDDLLAQCTQLLKPAGVLLLFGFHPWSMWQRQIRWKSEIRIQTPHYWSRSLRSLGLEVQRAERIGPAWPGAPGLFDRFGMAFALRAWRTGAAIIPLGGMVRAQAPRGLSLATRAATPCRRSA